MLSGGERNRSAAAQLGKGLALVGGEGFLNPTRAEWLYPLRPRDGVVEGPALEGVKHQLHIRTHGFAKQADQFYVLLHPFRTVARAIGEKPFLVTEAVV